MVHTKLVRIIRDWYGVEYIYKRHHTAYSDDMGMNGCTLRVKYVKGFYHYMCDKIVIIESPENKLFDVVTATVAHELGHHIVHAKWQYRPDMLQRRLEILAGENVAIAACSRESVLHNEIMAWFHGENVLRELGFTNWALFHKWREHCLASYVRHYFK